MQSNNIFQTPVSTQPRVPGIASTPVRPDFVSIPSSAEDESEKRQFIQTILITFGVCSIITVILFFLLLSNTSEASTSTTPTRYTIKDDIAKSISPTPRRLPTPTRKPTPTVPAVVKTSVAPTPMLTPTLTVSSTPTPTNTPVPTNTPTLTPTTTSTPTPTLTPTPTGTVTLSTELSSGTMNLGSVLINSGESWGEVIIRNGTPNTINLTDLFFSVAGSTNPYSIMDGADCLTNSLLPYSLSSGSTKCLRIKFKPVTGSNITNTIILYWNTSNLKSFSLTGVILTPTPTPTP